MAHTGLAEHTEVSTVQGAYEAAMEKWIKTIRAEEALAFVHPTVAQVDDWEHAHFTEEEARKRADKAKQDYEDAVRQSLFGF